MGDELAILGGTPVRKKPFLMKPYTNEEEKKVVLEAIERDEFSRYSGHYSAERYFLLSQKSQDALKISDFWSGLGGRNVREFEAAFADFFGVDYAIAVNSATSALSVALGACGVGPGDEVITTPVTFTATSTSILLFNAIPVFVDVDLNTFNILPKAIEQAITQKTKAILLVHLFGLPCDMDAIMEIAQRYNLKVIEDCAQAIGVKYRDKYVGTFGDVGIYSFQQTKNIMTGEGGMIITDDADLAMRSRLIRNHAEAAMTEDMMEEDLVNIIGFNFRMTELSAAVGKAQLKKLDYLNKIRNVNAAYLIEKIRPFNNIGIYPPYQNIDREKYSIVFHILALLYDASKTRIPREVIIRALKAEGIPITSGYSRPNYEHPLFLKKIAYGQKGCPYRCSFYDKKINYYKGMCPNAEELLYKKFLWFNHIGYPTTTEDLNDVIRAFEKLQANIEKLREHTDILLADYKEEVLR